MSDFGPRIPVTVLTGFLGSGKTTVLKGLVGNQALARIAVVINELGEIGIDHDLVEHSDERFVLVRNGCVCCTVRGDLIDALRDLSERRRSGKIASLDGVVIETTGLADPAPIIHTLMNDVSVTCDYGLSLVVTTVDAVNGAATLDAHTEAVKQAGVADLVLLTKCDLASPYAVAALRERIGRINPGARQQVVSEGRIAPGNFFAGGHFAIAGKSETVLAWLNAEGVEQHGHVHEHTAGRHDSQIVSYCITRDRPISREGFDAWLAMIGAMRGNDLLRVKGLVQVSEHPDEPLVVHGVQHVFHPPVRLAGWPSGDRRTRLVFITRNIERAAIDDTLRVFEHRAARRRKPADGGVA